MPFLGFGLALGSKAIEYWFFLADCLMAFAIFVVPLILISIARRGMGATLKEMIFFRILCLITAALFLFKTIAFISGLMAIGIILKIIIALLSIVASWIIWINPIKLLWTPPSALHNCANKTRHQGNVLDFTLQNIGDGVAVVNRDGKFMLLNPAAEQIFGITDGTVGIKSIDELHQQINIFYADTNTPCPPEKNPITQALRGEESSQQELFIRNTKNPSGFWVSITSRSVYSPYGNILGAVAVFTDITRRKQDEERLRHYAQEIEDLYNNAPVGYHSLNAEGRIVRVNNTELRWLGLSRDDVVGHSIIEFLSPASQNLFRERFLEFLKTGEVHDFKLELVSKAGATIPILVNAVSVGDSNGNFLHSRSVLLNLKERVEAEYALTKSESRFHTLAKLSPVGIFQADSHGNYIYVNEAWATIAGCCLEDVSGDRWLQAIHPADRERVRNAWQAFVCSTTVFSEEYRLVRPDGKSTWVFSQSTPEIGNGGSVIGFVGTITDVTEQKNAREALEKYALELRQSNEDLENFTHVASHDLREPLRMISYFVQRLHDRHQGKLDADADQCIEFILKGSRRLSTLIDDLLNFSRAVRDVSLEPTDVASVVCQVLEDLKSKIEETKSEITVDYLPVICIKQSQIAQVFQNLISNAIKYHKPGVPPKIHITADMDPETKCWVFAVEDNGIGIAKPDFEKLFILFSRLHTQDEYEGNGCGLATCKKIIERNRGRIWVESEVGVGSVFKFQLCPVESTEVHPPILEKNK